MADSLDAALRVLRETFGYETFRGEQGAIIQTLLTGDDALVLMPTGGGKSLCYQIPALLREGTGIVVSPLIALMQDQVDALRQLGVRAAFLNSTLDPRERSEVERRLSAGDLDLLYVAPERLLMEETLALLERSRLALFAIDEAHCVSQWGHDFRPEYRQLSVLHQRFPRVPRIALTATADARTREEIVGQLDLGKARRFISSFDRPNICYRISEGNNPRARLWEFLRREHPDDAGIVYCLSRRKVEETARWLCDRGREALPYHAGLPDEVRRRHQERFLREEGLIIVATIAFGMGIDKPDVRFVAHLNLPGSIEAWYQETGRAGRDGEPADAWTAYGLQDLVTRRQMVEGGEGSEEHKRIARQKLEAMLGLCEITTCRRQALLAHFGETRDAPCGNCDNCLEPPESWDATVAAQKALSCVYRTGQRFGVAYLVDVLLGKADERIARNGHDRISTFGIGGEHAPAEWRAIYRQLIARGLLAVDAEGYGTLRLTSAARPVLRGETPLQLRRLRKARPTRQEKARTTAGDLSGSEQALFESLRELRLQIAREQGVPPYVIFHDATLKAMASRRPDSLEALAGIHGIGQAKLERYGERFLAALQSAQPPDDNPALAEAHPTG
ncbi:MAG: DNA helicase RecQ [Gammaproteobacteria bacterium]|nr:MAG: DNA helicase RecQ [Gammaproteobacteria bacterium]